MRRVRLFSVTVLATLVPAASADAASVSPATAAYRDQAVGTSSAPVVFVLTTSPSTCPPPPDPNFCMPPNVNHTDTSALGGGPGTTTSADDFTVHNTNCHYPRQNSSFQFAGATSCQFEVRFAPTASVARVRTLSFLDSAGPSATLVLRGKGVAQRRKCKKRKPHRAVASKRKCKRQKKRG